MIRANHPPADRTVIAAWWTITRYVPVKRIILAALHSVGQSASLAQTVRRTRLALIRNVGTHALAPVARTLTARLSIIIRCAVARPDTLVIHSLDALKNVRLFRLSFVYCNSPLMCFVTRAIFHLKRKANSPVQRQAVIHVFHRPADPTRNAA